MDIPLKVYPNFQTLRSLARLAGYLAATQSVIWIAFSIVGLLAYFCVLDNSNLNNSLNSSIPLVFFWIYFKGECELGPFPELEELSSLPVLSPYSNNIFIWIYLILNAFWLFSSISLIKNVEENYLRRTNILLYIWILITLVIAALDLALSVVFGIDYSSFSSKFDKYNMKNENWPALLLSASVAAISMLIMAAKGFILWLINTSFAFYFFTQTFSINEAAISQTSLVNKDVVSDTQSVDTLPIAAYETSNLHQPEPIIRLNTEALQRATKMSEMSLKERYENRQNSNHNRFKEYVPSFIPNLPNPDYTPPMSRSKIFQGRQAQSLGNTRF